MLIHAVQYTVQYSFHKIYKFVKNIDIYDIDILCLDQSLYIGSIEKSEEALHKKAFADPVLRKFHQQPHPALALKDLMETRINKAHKRYPICKNKCGNGCQINKRHKSWGYDTVLMICSFC